MRRRRLCQELAIAGALIRPISPTASAQVNDTAARPDTVSMAWPMADGEFGRLTIDVGPGRPLVRSLGVSAGMDGPVIPILRDVEPAFFVTVGTREASAGRPPGMNPFNEFFDNPPKRPSQSYESTSTGPRRVRPGGSGDRPTLIVEPIAIGPFAGRLELTALTGSRLLQVEAVVRTDREKTAYLYDAGFVSSLRDLPALSWTDPEGRDCSNVAFSSDADRPVAVRHRSIAVESPGAALASMPPPHQFFFPRDFTTNVRTAWWGRGHLGLEPGFGFGIRQDATGGGNYVPWINAPPGTEQRLGIFHVLARGTAKDAAREALHLTRDDRFAALPGHVTFTSHYHMAIAAAAMKAKAEGREPDASPDFVKMFKDMNVQVVHLAEFHGDGHQFDPGPLRLPELAAMFAECRRLSDSDLLLVPGEEVDRFLGVSRPGAHPGHWMSLFPRPVYWILCRKPGQPLVEAHPQFGTVYRVGDAADVMAVFDREGGLAWTAHPRIKSSSWAPDAFRGLDYYASARWLGAAFKAMPADLSLPRLGTRGLDLLDDMANWGPSKKQLVGEVDVFTLDHTHELYGHMNINYLRFEGRPERPPHFDEGWQPVLDALRGGRFFTTTGEVLIREFTLAGKSSGETVSRAEADAGPEVRASLDWTFPLAFAEVISGDGKDVFRDRIDLSDTGAFGRKTLSLRPKLSGRKWARFEVWDVARNGGYTQPIWIGE